MCRPKINIVNKYKTKNTQKFKKWAAKYFKICCKQVFRREINFVQMLEFYISFVIWSYNKWH